MTAEVHPFQPRGPEAFAAPSREELLSLVVELEIQVAAIVGKPGEVFRRGLVERTRDALRREGRL